MITFKNTKYNVMKIGTYQELIKDILEMVEDGCKLKTKITHTPPLDAECATYQYNNKSTIKRYGGPVIVFIPYKDAVYMLANGDYRIAG